MCSVANKPGRIFVKSILKLLSNTLHLSLLLISICNKRCNSLNWFCNPRRQSLQFLSVSTSFSFDQCASFVKDFLPYLWNLISENVSLFNRIVGLRYKKLFVNSRFYQILDSKRAKCGSRLFYFITCQKSPLVKKLSYTLIACNSFAVFAAQGHKTGLVTHSAKKQKNKTQFYLFAFCLCLAWMLIIPKRFIIFAKNIYLLCVAELNLCPKYFIYFQ